MKNKKIIFRPISELDEKLLSPPPEPMKKDIPSWYKNLKRYLNTNDYFNSKTAKACLPFFDSITSGYSYKLPYDIHCTYDDFGNRVVNWGDKNYNYIGSHTLEQIGDYPIPDGYENIILKIHTSWCVQTPLGYSLLYMHPLGRFDLPFYSFHGLVDSDVFYNHINIPLVLKKGFNGIIKQGTPISQLIPIKRDSWKSEQKTFNQKEHDPFIDRMRSVVTAEKWYKYNRWIKKQYE